MQFLQESPGLLAEPVNAGVIHREGKEFESEFLENRRSLFGSVSAIVQQVMMQVDFDWARFGASAAE